MTTDTGIRHTETGKIRFPAYGWLGFGLVIIFWILNWTLQGPHTHWGFFPMWLGYCLAMDALVFRRTGTSLLKRSPHKRKYAGLFLISAPIWWIFELINVRMQNWAYQGAEHFTPLEYAFWTTLSFTTVVPAVFESAEFFASFHFIDRCRHGHKIAVNKRRTWTAFLLGWIMLVLMLVWPGIFFPFVWLSLFLILEPINIRLGCRSLAHSAQKGDWRPFLSLCLGVLLTAFFWEMWNYYSYPKWIYRLGWGNWWHVFEMPLLGYGGYFPFALELYAFYHLINGLSGDKRRDYVRVASLASS
jgi:hypothetical protein